jgi:pimeloyl-ACP methyl ester carboxylesterase
MTQLAPGRHRFDWKVDGRTVGVFYEVRGTGAPLLLLPSFSTVSSRGEMEPLAARFADRAVILVDWPGFGDAPQHVLPQGPALQRDFLSAFAGGLPAPLAVAAAGHAAGYVLQVGHARPGLWSRIVLLAPTWRGPLPTMMGGRRPVQERIRRLIETPVVGSAVYMLNTAGPVIAAMYRRHVYADPAHLTPALLAGKARVARRRNGRYGSAAFVTGGLDPVESGAAFLALLSPPPAPVLLVYGNDTPVKSGGEMMAMAALDGVETVRLPQGALGVHEEFAAPVAAAMRTFLDEDPPG